MEEVISFTEFVWGEPDEIIFWDVPGSFKESTESVSVATTGIARLTKAASTSSSLSDKPATGCACRIVPDKPATEIACLTSASESDPILSS